MTVTITSIELKSPWALPNFYVHVYRVVHQLKASRCIEYKTMGEGIRKHYTISLWHNEKDRRDFAMHNNHLRAMRNSRNVAREIRTLNMEAKGILPWQEAIPLLNERGKRIEF